MVAMLEGVPPVKPNSRPLVEFWSMPSTWLLYLTTSGSFQ